MSHERDFEHEHRHEDDELCKHCSGTGTILVKGKEAVCPKCHGAGYIPCPPPITADSGPTPGDGGDTGQ